MRPPSPWRPLSLLLLAPLLVGSGCASRYHIPGQDPYAAVANPPPILEQEIGGFPDPAHVQLRDGRVYRLSEFTDYPPTAPEFTSHRNRLLLFLAEARKDRRPLGLRPVAAADEGEEAVEFWSYPEPIGVCGNSTRAEVRRIQRHWHNIQDEVLFQAEGRHTRAHLDAQARWRARNQAATTPPAPAGTFK